MCGLLLFPWFLSLSTFVVTCPGAAYVSSIFNLYIIAHEGLDHTHVTYRTSICLVHFHRDEQRLDTNLCNPVRVWLTVAP